ncbi:hypothetical protein OH77DRAFT_567515 [Trametes cingulata]|nr:hypothetical protein OH77DRAFT_567515 [Trametes cingulata]
MNVSVRVPSVFLLLQAEYGTTLRPLRARTPKRIPVDLWGSFDVREGDTHFPRAFFCSRGPALLRQLGTDFGAAPGTCAQARARDSPLPLRIRVDGCGTCPLSYRASQPEQLANLKSVLGGLLQLRRRLPLRIRDPSSKIEGEYGTTSRPLRPLRARTQEQERIPVDLWGSPIELLRRPGRRRLLSGSVFLHYGLRSWVRRLGTEFSLGRGSLDLSTSPRERLGFSALTLRSGGRLWCLPSHTTLRREPSGRRIKSLGTHSLARDGPTTSPTKNVTRIPSDIPASHKPSQARTSIRAHAPGPVSPSHRSSIPSHTPSGLPTAELLLKNSATARLAPRGAHLLEYGYGYGFIVRRPSLSGMGTAIIFRACVVGLGARSLVSTL